MSSKSSLSSNANSDFSSATSFSARTVLLMPCRPSRVFPAMLIQISPQQPPFQPFQPYEQQKANIYPVDIF